MLVVLIAMIVYALLHSWLAGQKMKAAFLKRFGERAYHGLYRLFYNVLAVIMILPIFLIVIFRPGQVVWSVDLRLEPLLLIIQAIGLIGATVSLLQIDLLRFVGISQLAAYLRNQPLPLPDEPLQTKGLYALTRHPLYAFSLMVLWPVTTMTSAYLGFCIGATIYFLIGSYYEERRLIQNMGQTYLDYQSRVFWLTPRNKP